MIVAVLSGFVLALLAPFLHRWLRGASGWTLALLPLALTLYFFRFLPSIAGGETLTASYPWIPTLGIHLSFYLDGLSLLFALLICGIGTLVVIYAGGYLAGHAQLGPFYAYLLFFMASMLGLVLADNVVTLFVFWELTSLSSYLLIGFDHERASARAAALQSLLVTALGGLALLAGLLLLAWVGGSLELSVLLHSGAPVRRHGLYLPILLLVCGGAFTKSAQFPFHFWLPNAMEAPTPVSAYLHSATMVKAGVYLLARLSPILGGTEWWYLLVVASGTTTMLLGAYLALRASDLKRILAYSTVSSLGTLTMLLGTGTTGGAPAVAVYLLAHAFYKGALFLVAGAVDHETGLRDANLLGGLRRAMPITALAAAAAALSMAGLPPLLGFLGKELHYQALLPTTPLTLAAVATGMALVAVAGIAGVKPFIGEVKATRKGPHEAPMSLWLGPVVLGSSGLLLGVVPDVVGGALVSPTASAILGEWHAVELGLWHGLNPALGLSALTLAGGLGLYAGREWFLRATAWTETAARWGPAQGYEATVEGLNGLALAQTRLLQSGYLRRYLLTLILTTVVLAGYTLAARDLWPRLGTLPDVRFYEAGLAALILLAAVAAVRSRSRLAAVAALGAVGYGVALIYVLFGAADLAMTQFLVETLTVILFVLVLYHMPRFSTLSSRQARAQDLVVALSAGTLVTLFVLLVTGEPAEQRLAAYFAESSRALAYGRNIVNVILVDFRGLDTLGEITVLAVAGMGVYALLKLRPEGKS